MTLIEQFPIKVFNTLNREKVDFKPINEGRVGMYVCGPTVYGDPHLGHARGSITFDVIYRYLKFLGYKVRYVRNITDVGHLEDEVAGTGEDKVAKKARLEKIEPMEVVQHYTVRYRDAMTALNVLPPSIEPCASGHIIEQIEVIQEILKNGYAYESDGSVYFDMEAYLKDYKYGELSGKVIDDLQSNSREDLEGQTEKKASHDFALWKKAKPEHIMQWDSPWGKGFPGWHLECTAMSSKYLGLPFDIHGGGMDLQFPHHEGEIAQSFGAFGCAPVNYWLHNNMLTLDGQKMAKSKGNFINLDEMLSGNHELLEQAYSPMTIRFFMLQSHYGSVMDFSNTALQAAEKGYKRLINAMDLLEKIDYKAGKLDETLDTEINKTIDSCFEFMSDDFNTARTIASLFDLGSKVNAFYNKQQDLSSISKETFERIKTVFTGMVVDVLGLDKEEDGDSGKLDSLVNMLIDIRAEAKINKDFALSDKIRDELKEKGVMLKDEKGGVTTFTID